MPLKKRAFLSFTLKKENIIDQKSSFTKPAFTRQKLMFYSQNTQSKKSSSFHFQNKIIAVFLQYQSGFNVIQVQSLVEIKSLIYSNLYNIFIFVPAFELKIFKTVVIDFK